MSDPLAVFADLIRSQVQLRMYQAQELVQDARIISRAWDTRDVDTLVDLGLLDEGQAEELRRLVYPSG